MAQGNIPITKEIWESVLQLYRQHGPKHALVAGISGKHPTTVRRYWDWGFPPMLRPMRDILAEEKASGYTAPPAPIHNNMRSYDALCATPVVGAAAPTAPAPTPIPPPAPAPQPPPEPTPAPVAVVYDPATALAREAEAVVLKALAMRPKLIGAEIDQLTMMHDLERRIVADLLGLWKGLEPSVKQLVERMASKDYRQVSERETMRFIGSLLKHIKSASTLQKETLEQTRLVFGEPTAITETRQSDRPGAAPPVELLSRMAAMRERLQGLAQAQPKPGELTCEEGGDDGADDDDDSEDDA